MKSKPRFFARFTSFVLFAAIGAFLTPFSQAQVNEDEYSDTQDDIPAEPPTRKSKHDDTREKKELSNEHENQELSHTNDGSKHKHGSKIRSTAGKPGKGKRYPDLEVDPD